MIQIRDTKSIPDTLVLADSLAANKLDTGKKLCSFALEHLCSFVVAHSYTPGGERSGILAWAPCYILVSGNSCTPAWEWSRRTPLGPACIPLWEFVCIPLLELFDNSAWEHFCIPVWEHSYTPALAPALPPKLNYYNYYLFIQFKKDVPVDTPAQGHYGTPVWAPAWEYFCTLPLALVWEPKDIKKVLGKTETGFNYIVEYSEMTCLHSSFGTL